MFDASIHGLEGLMMLPLLRTLNLSGIPVTDAAISELKQMQSVRVFELHGTQITQAGAAELQEALPDCVVFHESLQPAV
jgi:hypothetical protein